MSPALDEAEVTPLLDELAEGFGFDFRGYHRQSVTRRIQSALRQTGAATVAELRGQLRARPGLVPLVLDCLTVQVSELFRDPHVYQAFRQQAVPVLRTYPAISLWIAGCAGGEEVFSLAILLAEEGLIDRTQLLATDLSQAALDRARRATVPARLLPAAGAAYHRAGGNRHLEAYFTIEGDEARLAESLRLRVACFQHDLGTDEVFGEMQAVFCRNVLIYFAPQLRTAALAKLQGSLCPGGFLVLGASERLLKAERSRVDEVTPGLPIYRRAEDRRTDDSRTGDRRSEVAPSRPSAPAAGQVQLNPVPSVPDVRPKVLLVDDIEDNLVALEAVLGDLPCDLHRAASGNEALRLLLKHEFAVMLLDVQMPDMDGYEVASHARDNPRTREVPIIFLTAAHLSEAGLARGYGSGAVDYLHKPLNPRVLRSKVSVFLELARSRQRLATTLADLEEARALAERANRFKSQFLANMSHELRTPLNAIIGFGELLEDDEGHLTPQHKEFIGHILSSGKHLVSLINDILDLSRIEAGRAELSRQTTSVGPLIQAALAVVRPTALKAGVTLGSQIAEDLPAASVDPVRFKQVLYNLLSNAVKFTPAGGKVTLRAKGIEGQLVIAVDDTGIGMRAEDLGRLFKEFERIQSASGPKAEGTGLGLALSKRLVEMHGGTIAVESEPGKGSTFTVCLPADQGG